MNSTTKKTLRVLSGLTAVVALLPAVESVQAQRTGGLHACEYQPNYRDVPCAEVDRAISESAAEFGVDDLKLRKIVRCESRFNPYADSGHYKGLFQQAPEYWQNRVAQFNTHHDPDAGNDIHSPFDNARISARMLAAGLDEHWPNCA